MNETSSGPVNKGVTGELEQRVPARENAHLPLARRLGTFLKANGVLVGLLGLVVVLSIISPYFLTEANLMNILRQVTVNALLAMGMTFVILTGGIDLSVGSVLALGGMVAAQLSSSTAYAEMPLGYAVVAGLAIGALCGLATGVAVAHWNVPPFVATLGMLSIGRGFTYILSEGMPVSNISGALQFLGQGLFLRIPMPVWVLAGVFGLAWFALYKLPFGRHVYAVGGSEEAAVIAGVNVNRVKLAVYVISGVLAALGGVVLTGRTTAGLPQAGVSYELDAIAAVVIGGTSLAGGIGSLGGTILGALVIGVVNNGLQLLMVSPYWQQVFKGAIIVAAVLYDANKRRSH